MPDEVRSSQAGASASGGNPFDLLEDKWVRILNERLSRFKLDASQLRGSINTTVSLPHTVLGAQHTDANHGDAPAEGDVLTYRSGAWEADPPADQVAAHVAEADPHPQYQMESEKDQPNGYAGLDAGSTLDPAELPAMVGDSGAGGVQGAVPAPAAGDATKYLKGDGTWSTPAGGPGGSLTVEELDGSPSVAGVTTLKVTSGRLTDNGGGVATLDLSAPAGSITVREIDGSPSVAGVSEIRVTNGKLTDVGGGVVSLDLSGGAGPASFGWDQMLLAQVFG